MSDGASRRDRWQSYNAVDRQHDLPVYRRLREMLTSVLRSLEHASSEKRRSFRFLIQIFFQFDRTLSPLLAQLALLIVTGKEQLEECLQYFESQLSKEFFQHILTFLAERFVTSEGDCPFVWQLQTSEKVQPVQ
jgi:hypothetical protein